MMFWKTFVKKGGTLGESTEQSRNKKHGDDLLDAIHYQLTTLLNSEAPMRLVSSSYPEVQRSLYCFGLDNSQSLSSQIDHDQFSRALERMIKAFEPDCLRLVCLYKKVTSQKTQCVFQLWQK
ncbi:hypothetical protein JCM19240_2474 [Vibrio maritimus]|uniref:Uncharacterized protein n=1 Tax=Vibrio maritimus TaxID=990268 RepID=A0A090T3I8_9VIBR|nr:hypothetical protein JCM19240_2474 [Vibrio maritimus]